jgi:hypothetical protein
MEVVVSAAVLILVVLGIFAGLDAVAGTAGANKARTVAATLAERDQEELRSLMTVDLNRIRSVIPGPRTVEVDGVPYIVESDADLVTDAGGEDISCSLDDGEGSFIRITSKVTSPMTGAKVKPVVISSIVAPEPGSGALVAKVVDARDNPVKNMPVQAIGPESITKTTNDAGCAVFGAVTAGAYEVKVNQTGWVDPEGDQEVIKTATVSAGTLTTVDFVYDIAATLTVNVQWLTGTTLTPDNSYGVIAAHTGILTGFRSWTTGTNPASPITLNRLFPFRHPYKIFSGRCMEQDPTGFQESFFDVYTAAAPTLTPGQTSAITILEPPVNLNATFTQSSVASNVYAYPRGGVCGDPVRYDLGPVVTGGEATRRALPYGTYDICVQFTRSSGSIWRRTITGVVNNTVDGGNTTRHPVAVTTSSPSLNSACPAS